MNKQELKKIKEKALKDKLPIIMDDTLEAIKKIFINKKPGRILEIGTAVRIFCYLFLWIFSSEWKNRYYRNRGYKSKRSKRKHKKSRSKR